MSSNLETYFELNEKQFGWCESHSSWNAMDTLILFQLQSTCHETTLNYYLPCIEKILQPQYVILIITIVMDW